MQFIPIKTRIFLPPKDDLFQIFDEYISEVKEGDIIFITSKILAIHQGRCIPVGTIEKSDLIKQEADSRTISDAISGHDTYLTLKNNILIPTAGIDESNANGHYILRPEHLPEATKQIYDYFSQRFLIKNIWIIITDSTSRIGKLGVVGIGISAYGINPIIDKRGTEDLFGRILKVSRVNTIDSLAAMAVYLMGEANECTPIMIGRAISNVEFTTDKPYEDSIIPPEQDLFKPLLQNFTWLT